MNHLARSRIWAVLSFGSFSGFIALGGCAELAVDSQITVRDSAGVQIVENATPLSELPVWTLSPEPVLDIGVLDGAEEYQLFRVSAATRLTSGDIAILNSGTSEVRIFDADGVHIRTIGREGEGPGEFRSTSALWQLESDGDEALMVWDGQLQRLSTFSLDGDLLFEMNPPTEGRFVDILGFMDNRDLLIRQSIRWETLPQSLERTYADYFALDLEADFRMRELKRHPDRELILLDGVLVGATFSGFPTALPVPDGYWFGLGEETELQRYGPGGELSAIARWPDMDRAVTNEAVESFLAWSARNIPDPERRAQRERAFENIPVSERFSSHRRLKATKGGSVWIESYRKPWIDSPRRWFVMNSDGHLVAHVDFTGAVNILEVGSDHILTLERDDLDVEHVRMYHLIR